MEKIQAGKLLIGISQCLLGDKVRFDGGHKRDLYVMTVLQDYIEFLPVCPEVAIGMGVPRPPIRQIGDADNLRVVGVKDPSFEVTKPLKQYSKKQVKSLGNLAGFILKSKSPTCGMERVKVYQGTGHALNNGVGVFARELMRAYPYLPVEEEGRLNDPVLRENFITRIFAYQRWLQLNITKVTKAQLIDFHTQHKLLLRSHNEAGYQRLGKLISDLKQQPLASLKAKYLELFMATLKTRATRKKHANVLSHLQGYLKKHLSKPDKQELLTIIEKYRQGFLPLIVPITLLKHHFSHHPDPYVNTQYYLSPHPDELMLRNHV